ncbi:MAG: hypothetical protein ABI295_07640 [Xanthomarina sp.]
MNSENIVPILIVSIIGVFLYTSSKKKPKKDGIGNIILQLPKIYSIIGFLVLTGGVGLFIFASFFADGHAKILASIFSLIAIITGLIIFSKGYISHFKVTDVGIIETSMFGKMKEIKWKEIEDVSFVNSSSELKIEGLDHTIMAHRHLVGFEELVSKLEQKTGKTRAEIGIPEGKK